VLGDQFDPVSRRDLRGGGRWRGEDLSGKLPCGPSGRVAHDPRSAVIAETVALDDQLFLKSRFTILLLPLIVRRHNQRLCRIARAIVRDDCEAEDVMQEVSQVRVRSGLDDRTVAPPSSLTARRCE
jgi:hypothetical protein